MVEIYKSLPVNGVRRIPYKRDQFGGTETPGGTRSDQERNESATEIVENNAGDVGISSREEGVYPNLIEQLASQNRFLNEEVLRLTKELETLRGNYSELLSAQTEAEELYKNKGYEVGYREGSDRAALDAKDRIGALVSAAEVFNYRLSEDVGLMQKDSVLLAYEALILIIGEHYKTPEFLNAILQSAVSKVADRKSIKLHLSKEDCDLVNQLLAENLFHLRDISEVIADDRIKKGGCIIETENGIWDARLDSQLERIKDALVTTMDGLRK